MNFIDIRVKLTADPILDRAKPRVKDYIERIEDN